MRKYVFRMHLCSTSLHKSGEGIEMEIRFVVKSTDYKVAFLDASLWAENLITKNPSLKMMYRTLISLVSEDEIE